jgi:hypothetical protein
MIAHRPAANPTASPDRRAGTRAHCKLVRTSLTRGRAHTHSPHPCGYSPERVYGCGCKVAAIGTLAGFGFHHSEGLAAVALVETNCNTSAGDAFMHTRMHMLAQYMSRGMPRMHEVQTKFTRTHARTHARSHTHTCARTHLAWTDRQTLATRARAHTPRYL